MSLLRLLPKSYFKISTFQPNFLCSSSFKEDININKNYRDLVAVIRYVNRFFSRTHDSL